MPHHHVHQLSSRHRAALRKHGMQIEREGSEADACLKLPRATPESMVSEWIVDRMAEYDYRRIVRSRSTHRILKSLRA